MLPILEVKNLNKRYDSFRLKNVSFSIKKGSITGFVGTNGSGKTTTIKSILGLSIKDSGSIKFLGQDMDSNSRKIKDQIGFVMDEGYFYEQMTLKEMKNIISPAYHNWDEPSFLRYIKRFNLRLNQKIETLSKGMRMKFAITLSLSHHAKLLIMDEPTSGLDPLVRSEILDLLLEFVQQEGSSVFFSTHITSDLDKIANTIILIDNGEIIFEKPKDELLKSHTRVSGDSRFINEETSKLFLNLKITRNMFEGITTRRNLVEIRIPKALFEQPTIEEIMLTYIER